MPTAHTESVKASWWQNTCVYHTWSCHCNIQQYYSPIIRWFHIIVQSVCVWLCASALPCDGLESCPGCTPLLAQLEKDAEQVLKINARQRPDTNVKCAKALTLSDDKDGQELCYYVNNVRPHSAGLRALWTWVEPTGVLVVQLCLLLNEHHK